MRELQKDNSAEFHFFEGHMDSEPGPGVAEFYEGPYYSYYQFPRRIPRNGDDQDDGGDASMLEAYDMLYDIIDDEGPFDGVLGFSQGGTLASGFLIHHAKIYPFEPPPFRSAVFFNSLPPFRMGPGEKPVADEDLSGYLRLPTLNFAGSKDFVLKHSLDLYRLCDQKSSELVLYDAGHDIPSDAASVDKIAAAIRKLALRALYP